jgi:hypothetical protein
VASAALGLLLLQGLPGCTPEKSSKGDNHGSGGGSAVLDAGSMDASHDAGDAATAGADAGVKANGYALAIPPDWVDDYLVLPPRFAPGLPLQGGETTREPPGMYEPTSDQFFSYAFLWRLDGNPVLDSDNLRSDITTYYQGLCGAATVTLAATSATALPSARAPVATFSGTLETGYCFGRPTPTARLEITTYDCPSYPSVLALISSSVSTSPISLTLAALRDGFDCY